MRFKEQKEKHIRVNKQINISPVMVAKDGKNLGIMNVNEAINLAFSYGLDLVEVSPYSRPPVCHIVDYSQFKYEQSKKKKELKPKIIKSKEIRLKPVSSQHDVGIRIEQIKKFLSEKRQVTVTIQFERRIIEGSKQQAREIIERILTEVSSFGKIDHPPKMEGRRMTVRLVPNQIKKSHG